MAHRYYVTQHTPDPANPEPFWWWHCECGEVATKEYADQAGAEEAAEAHRGEPHEPAYLEHDVLDEAERTDN